ncbi:MAG TPA: ABC transporter substrate-binding protein, partial [Thermomicrobiales bacterium]|nr:ABC transporter substrate-binding protein [Thermomicrobiales bacterium]
MPKNHSFEKSLWDQHLTRRGLAKVVTTAAGLAALAPALVSADDATPQSSPSPERPRGGTVTVASSSDWDTLDPHHSTDFSVWNQIFDPLVGVTKDLKYEGILAESWDISEDGLAYTFHLRKGITFHNGEPMNAAAVKFTYDRLMDPKTASTGAGFVPALKETVVVDEYTAKVVLSSPFSALLGNFTLSYFGILPPVATQQAGDDFGRNPVGTGPWKFKEWIASDHIAPIRNDDYHNYHSYMENSGPVYPDQLVFTVISQAATQ